jgi:hypothetical protein
MKANLKTIPAGAIAGLAAGIPIGTNVTYRVQGDVLVIEVGIAAETLRQALPSKGGKCRIVGSSGGFAKATPEVSFALNVITK